MNKILRVATVYVEDIDSLGHYVYVRVNGKGRFLLDDKDTLKELLRDAVYRYSVRETELEPLT